MVLGVTTLPRSTKLRLRYKSVDHDFERCAGCKYWSSTRTQRVSTPQAHGAYYCDKPGLKNEAPNQNKSVRFILHLSNVHVFNTMSQRRANAVDVVYKHSVFLVTLYGPWLMMIIPQP